MEPPTLAWAVENRYVLWLHTCHNCQRSLGLIVCHTHYHQCMTMLSFRVRDEEAAAIQRWATALGVDRSEILRDAIHRHLTALSCEQEADAWTQAPLT